MKLISNNYDNYSYVKEDEIKTKVANFLAKKISKRVPEKYKRDTKSIKDIHEVGNIVRDGAKSVGEKLPEIDPHKLRVRKWMRKAENRLSNKNK